MLQAWPRCVPDISQIYPRFVTGIFKICPKYVPYLSKIFPTYFLDLSQICLRIYPKLFFFHICPRYVPNTSQVYVSVRCVTDMFQACPTQIQDLSRYAQDMPKVSRFLQYFAGLGGIGKQFGNYRFSKQLYIGLRRDTYKN